MVSEQNDNIGSIKSCKQQLFKGAEYVTFQSFCFAEVKIQEKVSRANDPKDILSGTLKEIITKHEKQEEMINFSSNRDGSSSENINKGSICI